MAPGSSPEHSPAGELFGFPQQLSLQGDSWADITYGEAYCTVCSGPLLSMCFFHENEQGPAVLYSHGTRLSLDIEVALRVQGWGWVHLPWRCYWVGETEGKSHEWGVMVKTVPCRSQ